MRKAKPKKRVILPDPVYNDQKVSKFVNHLMYDGKKNTSYEIFYKSLDIVKEKMSKEEKSALEIWKQALDNITPQVEVKSRRIGGATFQVPTEIRADRKESISMKNMINYARKRGGKSMAEKLAAEIMDAYNNQGGAYKRKEDMHRMAEANRAFAHFLLREPDHGEQLRPREAGRPAGPGPEHWRRPHRPQQSGPALLSGHLDYEAHPFHPVKIP